MTTTDERVVAGGAKVQRVRPASVARTGSEATLRACRVGRMSCQCCRCHCRCTVSRPSSDCSHCLAHQPSLLSAAIVAAELSLLVSSLHSLDRFSPSSALSSSRWLDPLQSCSVSSHVRLSHFDAVDRSSSTLLSGHAAKATVCWQLTES